YAAVVSMGLVEIDPVCLEPFQAFFAFPNDLARAQTSRRARVIECQLRRDHHLISVVPILHPFADCRFAFTAMESRNPTRVKVSCVKKVAALFEIGVEQGKRFLSVDVAPD